MTKKYMPSSLIFTILIFSCSLLSGCASATSVPPPHLDSSPASPGELSRGQATVIAPPAATATFRPVPPTATAVQPAKTSTPPVEEGIRITKYRYNFTAFKIEMPNGTRIISDPYMINEMIDADVVTESHQHLDHTDVLFIRKPYELLTGPGLFEIAGVKITGVAGLHNKPIGVLEASPDNSNIIYVFDLGDIRLAQFASQGSPPTQDMYEQIGKVDVLIIQIFMDHESKLNMREAGDIAAQLSARIIIPAHGDEGVGEEFSELIGADYKTELSGVLNVSRKVLDALTTPVVTVLDH